jgi:uncharacterized protein
MRRTIVWEWADRPGLEQLSLDIGPDEIRAEGLVIAALGGVAARVKYSVTCDGAWRFREALLTSERGEDSRILQINRAEGGAWLVDGAARSDLAPCTSIDIMATPFTNTLPIRTLRFQPGEARALKVAYIKLPELEVTAVEQEYTWLKTAAPPTRFRYRSLASGFTAELSVDSDGLVIDYQGIWRRLSGN